MKFKVSNMNCVHCQNTIKKVLKDIGINRAKFNLETQEVTVVSKNIDSKTVEEALNKAGYSFELI